MPTNYEQMTYVEAFAGGANLLLNKSKSNHEIINDIDTNIMSVWWAIKYHLEEFIDRLKKIDYIQEFFYAAIDAQSHFTENKDYTMDMAICEYTLRRMSRGGMKKAFAWSERLRGGKPGDVNAWDTMLELLPTIANRVKDVELCNHDWTYLLEIYNSKNVVFYLDPPYLKCVRSATNVYDHEMSEKDHVRLLDACNTSNTKIMISGYQSPLYSQKLKEWNFKYRPIVNHASQQDRKPIKLECIWYNY